MEELFRTVLHEDKYHIAVGNQAVSAQSFETIDDARAYIESKPWELIGNLSAIIAKHIMETNQLKKLEK